MTPSSSSGSWSAAAAERAATCGERAADIIDLDRFMRAGGVRPGARRKGDKCKRDSERLVVDAGGIGRKPASEQSSTSVESALRERDKRYSHDSGLSDGSYVRRRQREHRRGVNGAARERPGSSHSMRTFRAACEQALRDQQEQIARVAQICERLSAYRAGPHPAARPPPARSPPSPRPRHPPAAPTDSGSADSSELSSSSRSTRDQRRRDKRRTAGCKTYKIIMSKLDELNQLFAARGRFPPARAAPPPRSSSGSVSVSDKLVSTEPVALKPGSTRILVPAKPERASREERAVTRSDTARWSRLAALRTLDLDIAPQPSAPSAPSAPAAPAVCPVPRLNVTTENVVQCETSSDSGSSGAQHASHCTFDMDDPLHEFDLDDPVHLYEQAKRLQALHAHARRTRSAEPAKSHCGHAHAHAHAAAHARAAPASLCALCRGYWRALTGCLASQLCRVDRVY